MPTFNNITPTQEGVQALLTYNKDLRAVYMSYMQAAKKLTNVMNANAPQMGGDEGLAKERIGSLANQLLRNIEGDSSAIQSVGNYSKVEGARLAKLVYSPGHKTR